MSVNRREFLKSGTAGLVALSSAGASSCWGNGGELHVRFRGLLLFQRFPNSVVAHGVDTAALSLPNHLPVLRIRKSAIDLNAGYPEPSRKAEENTTRETWEWDLKGKQVGFRERDPASDSLTFDTSQPTLPNPGANGTWTSIRLIPDLKKLCGATQMTRFDASAVQIGLRDGRLQADRPRAQNGFEVVWRFRNPANNQVVFEQGLSDTLLYRCPLNGQAPVIRLNSERITLASPDSEFITIENMMNPPPIAKPDDPFSLGHFAAFYKLVDAAFEPEASAHPPSPAKCEPAGKCDVEPIYCPPADIGP